MDDLVQRLRDRAYSSKIPDPLCEQAAAEIERLREYLELAESELSIARLPNGAVDGREKVTSLRDTFAAAALSGLLVNANDDDEPNTPSDVAYTAYEMADAMLRERSRTNHDAAPAARAHSSGNDGPSPDSHGTGDKPVTEPTPVVASGSGSVTPVSYEQRTEQRVDWHTIREPLAAGGRAACGRAEAATPDSPSLSGAAVTDGRPAPTAEPVAWGVMRVGGGWRCIVDSETQAASLCKGWDNAENWVHEAVPLYRHPSPCPYVVGTVTRYCALTPLALTDAEREAVERTGKLCEYLGETLANKHLAKQDAATLRGLLERTKNG